MRRVKEWISVMLSIVIILASAHVPVLANEGMKDVAGHWAETVINDWVSEGIINGYSDGSFKPNANINRAEFYTLINNVINLQEASTNTFVDVKSSDWYSEVVDKAASAGLASGYNDRTFRPSQPMTRQEVAVVIANMMNYEKKDTYTNISRFVDGSEVANWAKSDVEALIQKGLFQGSNKQLNIKDDITRAEVVTLLNRAFGTMYLSPGTYGGTEEEKLVLEGNVTISSKDVVIKNVIIEGDLYISEGVADGEVNLDNVIVKGNTLIKGGGQNSIYFNNVSVEGALVVKKIDNKIRLVASGSTEIKATVLASGAILVERELIGGGFESITIPQEIVAGAEIEFDGAFDEVNIEAKNIQIKVDDKAVIGKINVRAGANQVKIDGDGTIEEVEVDESVEGTEVDGKDVNGGETISNEPTANQSSGSNQSRDDDEDDVTPPTTTSGAIYIDSRFASGYPSISLNENNFVVLKVKLTNASDTNPVTVHYIADQDNTDEFSSVEAVLHGHAGTDYPYYVSQYGDVDITDTEEYIIQTDIRISGSDFATGEFVLVDNDKVSEEVTRVEITGTIYDELDTYAPYLSSYDGTYINKEYTSLSIPVSEKVIVEEGAESSFSITVKNATTTAAIIVTDVRYHAANEYYDYLILDVDGLSKDIPSYNISVNYTNNGLIYDESVNKNSLSSKTVYGFFDLEPYIRSWLASEDYLFNMIEVVNGANEYVENTITVKGITNGNVETELDAEVWGYGFSNDYIDLDVFIGESDIYEKYIISADFIDVMGNTVNLSNENVEAELIPEVSFYSAEYDVSYGFLTINYTGELDYGFACMFTMMVNDEQFIPKGSLYVPSGEGFLEIDADQLGVDIQAGDVVKIKYEPKHQGMVEDILGQELEASGEWITVQVIE